MNKNLNSLLNKSSFNKNDLISLLSLSGEDEQQLFKKAYEIKAKYVGRKTYFRGLIEFSNICSKNCYYCGIRRSTKGVDRYELTDEEVMGAVKFAMDHNWGSLVIQAGERNNKSFTDRITHLLKTIKSTYPDNPPGITLSLGEQSEEVFQEWFNAGAHRYLLRIESSTKSLYNKIHPLDTLHSFDYRLENLKRLQNLNYQTGTGVMIGMPFQTIEHLADDLIFMQNFDIDMCGMGPYIEHNETPLYQYKNQLMPIDDRFQLSLRMIAILRIIMKDINIASATALQAIHPQGREMALRAGANVIMPNLTPVKYHENYHLYKNKPTVNEETDRYIEALEKNIHAAGDSIGHNEWGDPKHYFTRISKNKHHEKNN
ncbi:MAG: [FeFe] hydrogenase H-cluster radical SAM maturase HydE [Bacteroidota bacterium]|nr:[FeFe] hydrogenase H-cluster radical SAM maturase HydE [Bacteroidota bacterium]